jgi:predicted phage terminase large subunit-like protein
VARPLPGDDLARLALQHRIEIERELGSRSFWWFFRWAWRYMDPAPFVDGWHLRLMCEEMERLARRDIREIVLCVPPRHTKSLLCSVAFPAWVWTWHPAHQFITASYDLRLAVRDGLKTRRLVQSKWYQQRWPQVQFRPDQNTKTLYETTAGGHRFITTPHAGITGHGGDTVIADDPLNAEQAKSELERENTRSFWFESASSRLNDQRTGAFLVIQQRLHMDDLAGHCMRRGYYKVVLPALYESDHPDVHPRDPRQEGEPLWHQRVPKASIERQRVALGEAAFAGQQQQRPAPKEGGLFKRAGVRIVDAIPAGVLQWVRRWDLAGTEQEPGTDPDWTVGVKMGSLPDGRWIIAHVARFRGGPLEVEKTLKATADLDGPACVVGLPQDPGQAGKAQVRHLRQLLAGSMVSAAPETGSKHTRAGGLAAQWEAGNVLLLRGEWNHEFIEEMCFFDSGTHDDQVDAAAGAFNLLTQNTLGLLGFLQGEFERERQQRLLELALEHARRSGCAPAGAPPCQSAAGCACWAEAERDLAESHKNVLR